MLDGEIGIFIPKNDSEIYHDIDLINWIKLKLAGKTVEITKKEILQLRAETNDTHPYYNSMLKFDAIYSKKIVYNPEYI